MHWVPLMSLICQMGSCTRRRCSPLCTWDTPTVEESLPAALWCRSLRPSSLMLPMKVQPLKTFNLTAALNSSCYRALFYYTSSFQLGHFTSFIWAFIVLLSFTISNNISLFCHHKPAFWISCKALYNFRKGLYEWNGFGCEVLWSIQQDKRTFPALTLFTQDICFLSQCD